MALLKEEIILRDPPIWEAVISSGGFELRMRPDFKIWIKEGDVEREGMLATSGRLSVIVVEEEGRLSPLLMTSSNMGVSLVCTSEDFTENRSLTLDISYSIHRWSRLFLDLDKWRKELKKISLEKIPRGPFWREFLKTYFGGDKEGAEKIEKLRDLIDAYRLYGMMGSQYQRLGFYDLFRRLCGIALTMRFWGDLMAAIMNDAYGERKYDMYSFSF